MMLKQRVQEAFQKVNSYEREDLKSILTELDVSIHELQEYLKSPEGKPYYRQMIYEDEHVEMIVMNWAAIECAPHDHGQSVGWIQVIEGETKQTIYKAEGDSLPLPLFTEYKEKGKMFFAPRRGVHKMKRNGDDPLVTLHLYSPPIRGMKVYDLETCAACVVSSDCGAWWPNEQRQRLKEIKLKN
ncbi:cysteine dioxygenase family protein [Halobacillus sp. Marseille-Q1614]|uniref:cysteine dioxygenase n=1 Tax=Halobacillus sp. Marseille-Q1614 TaxID=2709134 RepID=UPI00156EE714|nr:cysteine dioxygenase family protein [Halobacillus sp. Marseille-Q1614]